MTTLLKEIEQKASALTPEEREILAVHLLASVDGIPVCDIDDSWIEVVEHRYAAWKAGLTHAIPEEEALCDIRRELKR